MDHPKALDGHPIIYGKRGYDCCKLLLVSYRWTARPNGKRDKIRKSIVTSPKVADCLFNSSFPQPSSRSKLDRKWVTGKLFTGTTQTF